MRNVQRVGHQASGVLMFRRLQHFVGAPRLHYAAATEHGDALGFHRALFKAYFTDMADISDPDILVETAVGAGLDGAALAEALSTGQYRRQVVVEMAHRRLDAGGDRVPRVERAVRVLEHVLQPLAHVLRPLGGRCRHRFAFKAKPSLLFPVQADEAP